MNKLFKIFSIASLLATSAFCTTSWIPPAGSNTCTTAGAFTVKAIQFYPTTSLYPSASGSGKIIVFLAEYPGITTFQHVYSGTSATEIEQANAMLSLLETAKATGTKVSLYDPNISCGVSIAGHATYDFSVAQMDSYP